MHQTNWPELTRSNICQKMFSPWVSLSPGNYGWPLIEHKITVGLGFGSGPMSAVPEDFLEKGARTAGQ
jgi:hypothetical protein